MSERTYPLHGTCDGCAEGGVALREDDLNPDAWVCANCDAAVDTAKLAFRAACQRRGIPDQYLDAAVEAIQEYNAAYWDEATK